MLVLTSLFPSEVLIPTKSLRFSKSNVEASGLPITSLSSANDDFPGGFLNVNVQVISSQIVIVRVTVTSDKDETANNQGEAEED